MENDELKKLEHSLIYAMSLGSRELYHSNVWAWLMETDSRYINVFFSDYECEKSEIIKGINREGEHFDISFKAKGNGEATDEFDYYIIENKIKSLPSIEQLERYNETVSKFKKCRNSHKVLVVLINLYSKKDQKLINDLGWNIIEYKDVAERIQNCIDKGFTDKFIGANKEIVIEYYTQIANIYSVIKNMLKRDENKYTYREAKNLGGTLLRLDDVYKKLKGWDVFNSIANKLKQDTKIKEISEQLPNYELYIDQSFNHKKITLDFRWQHKDELQAKNKWASKRLIGVQIEEFDYRFVYGEPSEENSKDKKVDEADNIFSELSKDKYKWFDKDYNPHTDRRLFGKYPTSLSIASDGRLYNKYLGDQIFVYQYYDLPGKKNKTEEPLNYEELYKKIQKDLIRAADIIK